MVTLDDLDRRIIQASQAGLPLSVTPYATLAEQLGLPADEVMQRLRALQEHGSIRRIAAVPNHYRLGFQANGMSVWDIPDERIDDLGQQVGRLAAVSHCYHRPRYLPDWPYNLFAMVHGKTRVDVEREIGHIRELLGKDNRDYTVLYSTRILKKTGLRLVD